MIFTASTLQNFLVCPKSYFFDQIVGIQRKGLPEYMGVSVVLHKALELYKKEGIKAGEKHIKDSTEEAYEKAVVINPNFDTNDIRTAETYLTSILHHLPWNVDSLQGAEIEFKHPVGLVFQNLSHLKDHYFAGKVDGIGLDPNGRQFVVDYKLKGSFDRMKHEDVLRKNFQASFYYYLNLPSLPDLEYVQFRMCKRPMIRQTKKETFEGYLERLYNDYKERPDFYFYEANTFRDPKDKSFLMNLSLIIVRILASRSSGHWQENSPACAGCNYLAACVEKMGWEDMYDWVGPDYHPELEKVNSCRKPGYREYWKNRKEKGYVGTGKE